MTVYVVGAVWLGVMLAWAALDERHRREDRAFERRQVQRDISDLEYWLEIADRKDAAQVEREAERLRREELAAQGMLPGQSAYQREQADMNLREFDRRKAHELERRAYLGDV